ncbi:hypothetical protein WN73_37690 [Bradyrhizobium sp. CCBAU 45394]|uniref:tyrosine-type recombinase/integrase n=1 Tax=Bradyrhizobium sp. CCBAU 45394 TaxID=1325087 RepID=UPI0023045E08|nr:tyrosine-type recombinase/integrase [Bradyrhizobium sp. CCBAU 45394]MDA9396254.1 hypothetical protein [Bradyrhizobium sp. CCBAU 45394]
MPRLIPSPEQCVAIFSFDDCPDADLYNAALALLYGCGPSMSEVLKLRRCDILIGERMRLSIAGSSSRVLPVPKGSADRVLRAMNRPVGHSDDEFLFLRGGRRIRDLGPVLTRRSKMLGFAEPLSTTDLRHAFALHMMERNAPFEIVAAMMGYRDPNWLHRALTGSFS